MKILVVEDSPAARDLLRRALEEAGHTVALAATCEEGRVLARGEQADLAILDVMLPDGSGIDLCRELRAEGRSMPILFLTARHEVEDRIAGLDAGGDDYLRKPFAIAELRARVRALSRRRVATAPARLEHGGTRIDFPARRLTREGRDVPLTAREWAVLAFLAEQPGRVVTRADVVAAAWPRAGPGAFESLDVIVSRLRRKLGERGAIRIRALRGQGLALETTP